jgi:hypothetical protein
VKRIAIAGVFVAAGCASHVVGEELEPTRSGPAPEAFVVIPDQPARSAGVQPEPEAKVARDCIDDVLADADAAWAADAQTPADVKAVAQEELSEELGDLDGDDRPEVVVVNEPLCGVTGNCPMRVYLSAQGCPSLALDTFAAYVWPAESRRHGVRALESWAKDGCAGMAGGWAAHRFDGTRYVVVETVECGCPDGEAFGWPAETSRPAQCPG